MSSNWNRICWPRWRPVAVFGLRFVGVTLCGAMIGCGTVDDAGRAGPEGHFLHAPMAGEVRAVRQVRHSFLVDFDRGFSGETFSLQSGGEHIATMELRSRQGEPAYWLSLESAGTEVTLTFRDDGSGREWKFFFDLTRGTYFAVDLIDGEVSIRQSRGPFMYGEGPG